MRVSRSVGIGLLVLSGVAALVIGLLPLGFLQRSGMFLGAPERSLWLLFVLCSAFGANLFALGVETPLLWRYLKRGGKLLLVFGLVSATEILLVKAFLPGVTSTISLWWLFVICNVFGGSAVYAPEVAARIELKAAQERAKRMEWEASLSREEELRVSLGVRHFRRRR